MKPNRIKLGRTTAAVVLASGLAVAGCQQTGGSGQWVGGALGATAGALIGSQIGDGTGQIIATVAGGLIGGFIGSEIGAALDERDRQLHTQAANAALASPTPTTKTWTNPNTGNSGVVRTSPAPPPPRTTTSQTRTQTASASEPAAECRNIEQIVTVDGEEQSSGVQRACRNSAGEWEVMA